MHPLADTHAEHTKNRKPLKVFLLAQTFNIIVTLAVAYLMFGVIKPFLRDF